MDRRKIQKLAVDDEAIEDFHSDHIQDALVSFQKLIDKCVKIEYDYRIEELLNNKNFLSIDDYMNLLTDEILRLNRELSDIKRQCRIISESGIDKKWEYEYFIIKSYFCETAKGVGDVNLSIYSSFDYDSFNIDLYLKNPKYYDESLPFLSDIVKFVANCNYFEFVNKELRTEEKRQDDLRILKRRREAEKEEKGKKSVIVTPYTPEEKSQDNFSSQKNESSPKEKIEKNFYHKFNDEHFEVLTNCINEARIFKMPFSLENTKDFFNCCLDIPPQSRCNRHLVYFLFELDQSCPK